jgi:hypothetical protein
MKKIIIFCSFLLTICCITTTHTGATGVTTLSQLASPNKKCYCVPAPGWDCFSPETGTIYPDYKIVCDDETLPPTTAFN